MVVALHLARRLVQQAHSAPLPAPLVTSSVTGRAGDFTVTSPGLSKNALAVGATQVGMQAAAWLGAPVTCWVVFCCKGQAADCNERAEL